jgi:hypothetical protein
MRSGGRVGDSKSALGHDEDLLTADPAPERPTHHFEGQRRRMAVLTCHSRLSALNKRKPMRERCSHHTMVGAAILATARCRSGQSQFMSRLIVGLAATLLVSAGLGSAALGPAAGIAHAGAFHWCPGNPPPQGMTTDAAGHAGHRVPIYPAWDTSVCHDYVIEGDHVKEGSGCGLPQFQWFQCPPGTTPVPQMPIIPNKGE